MAQGSKKIFEYKEDINGKVPVIVQWSTDYNFIACGGDKQIVYILDKRGKKLKDIQIPFNQKLLQLDWDKDNEFLCIVLDGLNFVYLWQVFGSNQLTQLEIDNTRAKVSYAKWSRSHGILAIGSDKGGVLFYTKKQQKKFPTMGKHSKKIISADWNNEGYLITSGEDKLLTVSNYSSETVYESIPVKAEAKNVQWSRSKTENREIVQRTVTAIVQQKSIIMFELGRNHKLPDELVFESKYGKIVDYQLFGDGYIVIGFSEGQVAHISTHRKEIKDEVQSEKIFNSVDAICTNDILYKLAVAGDGKIKMINLSSWQEIKNEQIDLPSGYGKVSKLHWNSNGQILVVCFEKGLLLGYLTSVPTLTATSGQFLAIQQSFTEIVIMETSNQSLIPISAVLLENEPNFFTISSQYFGAAINNIVYYYQYLDTIGNKVFKQAQFIMKKDYLGFVSQLQLNMTHAAVLSDNRCTLHAINAEQTNQEKYYLLFNRYFPTGESEKPIQHIGLTRNFLYMLDATSKIRIYNFKDEKFTLEFKNDYSFVRIFPNFSGTRCICINNKGQGFLFESSLEQITRIAQFPEKAERVIWDQKDPNVFISVEQQMIKVYIVNKNNIYGDLVNPVMEWLSLEDITDQTKSIPCITELDKGLQVLSLANGYLKCFTAGGSIQSQALMTHSYLNAYKNQDDDNEGHFRYFLQNLALYKYANALKAAQNLKILKILDLLGRKCLENLEFDVAQKAFQKCSNIGMVMTIQSFKHETEKNLLCAYAAMILGQHDLSQDLFLKSSYQLGALELRSDIQDHANALSLARKIAPEQEPFICKRLAIQIETQGNNPEALKMYELAQLDQKKYDAVTVEQHNLQCNAGIARCSIKMGDILRGTSLARSIKDSFILQDIALVCENMKQIMEAAELYEQAGVLEKAAALYISQKMFKQAAPLMNKIKSPKLLTLYAKAKESENAFKEAESAYEKAEEWESVVRLNLNQLDNIEKAKFVLRNKCQTATLASMVAQYCERRGSKAEAIEFLIMASKKEEAFALAQNCNEMDSYVDNMKAFSLEERLRVAQYYEGKSQLDKAAFHYEKAQDPLKALRLYQQAGEECIPDMIELVQKNRQENLIQNLLDYLTGETDDNPKDPQHAYKLYKSLDNLPAASRIAITIAGQEQEQGKYREAHLILYETCDDMKQSNNQIPFDLYQRLLLVHSYVIVRRIIKLEEHEDAARLLDRVCKSISQFPQHAPNILTTAVIEATRANFKSLAFQWAAILMKPEYRPNINEKYKKQIENIARKPVKDEIVETKTPCPFCGEYVPEFQLDCNKCSNNIPFCIASGKHIIAEQCCLCPECKFPANIQYFRRILDIENTCPLCAKEIKSQDLKEIPKDEVLKLKRKNIIEDKEKKQ